VIPVVVRILLPVSLEAPQILLAVCFRYRGFVPNMTCNKV
jgi:hypothetical protein